MVGRNDRSSGPGAVEDNARERPMKLASYRTGGRDSFGIVREDGIVDLGSRLPDVPDMMGAIAAGALTDGLFADEACDLAHAGVEWTIPVPRPEKIWCIGVNYADRNAEYKDGTAPPKYPSLFCRTPSSFVGHAQPLERPRSQPSSTTRGRSFSSSAREGVTSPARRRWIMSSATRCATKAASATGFTTASST
jgi:hypothetical protein